MANFFFVSIFTFFSWSLLSVSNASNPPCSQGHCSSVGAAATAMCNGNAQLLGITEEEYKKRGGAAITAENGRICQCPCSCVVADTNIATTTGYIPIKDLTKGTMIATPLSKATLASSSMLLSTTLNDLAVQKTTFSNGSEIISSPNHTFITPNEMIISAEQLKSGDKVLAADGQILTITTAPEKGTFDGTLYNLSVNENSQDANDHIIDTNGILSGDWLLQSTNDLLEEELFLRTTVVELFDN